MSSTYTVLSFDEFAPDSDPVLTEFVSTFATNYTKSIGYINETSIEGTLRQSNTFAEEGNTTNDELTEFIRLTDIRLADLVGLHCHLKEGIEGLMVDDLAGGTDWRRSKLNELDMAYKGREADLESFKKVFESKLSGSGK